MSAQPVPGDRSSLYSLVCNTSVHAMGVDASMCVGGRSHAARLSHFVQCGASRSSLVCERRSLWGLCLLWSSVIVFRPRMPADGVSCTGVAFASNRCLRGPQDNMSRDAMLLQQRIC